MFVPSSVTRSNTVSSNMIKDFHLWDWFNIYMANIVYIAEIVIIGCNFQSTQNTSS